MEYFHIPEVKQDPENILTVNIKKSKLPKPLKDEEILPLKIEPKQENNSEDDEIKLKYVRVVLQDIKSEIPEVKKEETRFFLEVNTKNLKIPKPLQKIKVEEEKKIKPSDKAFPSRSRLANRDFHCKTCDQKYKRKAFFDKHVCPMLNNKSDLKVHKKIPNSSNCDKFECDFCGKILITRQGFLTHLRALHSTAVDKKYQCDLCGKKFADQTILRPHIKGHKKIECKICKRTFGVDFLRLHLKTFHAEKGSFKCEKCPRTYKSRACLIRHLNSNHSSKYQCKICNLNFVFSKNYKGHMKFHENDKNFQCKICKKNYNSPLNLQMHTKRMHTEKGREKKFKCDKCEYACCLKGHFKAHQKVHENYEAKLKSRPNWFKCEKCPALLTSLHTLKAHIKNSHGTYQFECDCCGKMFRSKQVLYCHLMDHYKIRIRTKRLPKIQRSTV